MKPSHALLCALLLAASAAAAATSVYDYPRLQPRHAQLRQAFLSALRSGDTPAMERVCRAACELIPDDPTWHYNLACSLAYRAAPGPALDELARAIDLGFRDADAIAQDHDLARIAAEPRFKDLVAHARATANLPVPGRPAPVPLRATMGVPGVLTTTNLTWDLETGCFQGLLRLVPPANAATSSYAAAYKGPAAPLVAAWLSEGTVSGNLGDLYMNRDRGHSPLAAADFPLLTPISLEPAARAQDADIMLPNLLLPRPVFGNASLAMTAGPFWRSLPRLAMTDPGRADTLQMLYLNNQFWVFPAHKDADPNGPADCFPAAVPFLLATAGSSWSDQPYLRAALAASSSFRRDTKTALVASRRLAPTLQMLIRRSRRGVNSDADYLSPAAHPTVFRAADLDVDALVTRAHDLRPAEIPPVIGINFLNSTRYPIHYPVPVRDYPDNAPECLFSTPFASCIVLRGVEALRTFVLQAHTLPEADPTATYTWAVVHGDPAAVKISAPLGEIFNDPSRGFAQIVIDRRHLTNRIDIACFAKTPGTSWGAPSFVSFYPVPQETRTYRPDGKIDSIDYSNLARRYTDPIISLPRRWKDTYTYSKDGACTGFVRSYNGQTAATFTPAGERVVSARPDGSPLKTVPVKYVPRNTGVTDAPPELTYVDDEPAAADTRK